MGTAVCEAERGDRATVTPRGTPEPCAWRLLVHRVRGLGAEQELVLIHQTRTTVLKMRVVVMVVELAAEGACSRRTKCSAVTSTAPRNW